MNDLAGSAGRVKARMAAGSGPFVGGGSVRLPETLTTCSFVGSWRRRAGIKLRMAWSAGVRGEGGAKPSLALLRNVANVRPGASSASVAPCEF